MEVPGKRVPRDRTSATDTAGTTFCQRCLDGGRSVVAVTFCDDCQAYLCKSCTDHHKIVKDLKRNSLVHSTRLSQTPVKANSETSLTCSAHIDKLIKSYCASHNSSVCEVCATLHHKQCKLELVSDVSVGFENSTRYKAIRNDLDQLENNVTSFLTAAQTNIKKTEENGKAVVEDIRKFREEINQYLKKKEEELILAIENMLRDDTGFLKKIKLNYESIRCEVSEMGVKVDSMKENCNDLFITSTSVSNHLAKLKGLLGKFERENQTFLYSFRRCPMLSDLLDSRTRLGSVEKEDNYSASLSSFNVSRLSRVADFDVRFPQDINKSYILGITFSPPNSLLLADNGNKCVKSIDSAKGSPKAYLLLSEQPWDITSIGPDQAAVTVPKNKMVQFISTNNGLSVTRSINVSGQCHGIDATADKLFVSFVDFPKVEVLDHFGQVIGVIASDSQGVPHFSAPVYVKVCAKDADRVAIYVSDYDTNTVSKMSLRGDVMYRCRDPDLTQPKGLAITGREQLLVCGWGSNSVHLVSPSGKKVRAVLVKRDGITCPQSLCFNAPQKLVYVSCGVGDSNKLKVYRVE